ncbi:MAG: hypothetical protein AAGA54_34075 [Myxococcota bacterium]
MLRTSASATLFALSLVATGCKSETPAPKPGTTVEEDPQKKVVLVPEVAKAAVTAHPAAADVFAPEPEVNYAAELEPLLDLVPKAQGHFIAVRDPAAALRLFDALVGVATPTVLTRLSERDPDIGEARVVLEEIAKLRDALIAAKVDLDKGMLFLEEEEALIYGLASEDPSAIKVALKAVGVEDDDLPPTCVAPPAMPGFAACGDDEAALKALAPGKHGATLSAGFKDALPGFDVARANAFLQLSGESDVLMAVATPPGRMHVVMGLGDVAKEVDKYVEAGKPEALGLLAPGAGFVWGRLKMSGFEKELAGAPAPAQNVIGTLTGEMFAGGTPDAAGALLVGVNDPFPASGLVGLASLQADMLKSQLPEGSVVEVAPVEAGKKTVSTFHVQFALDEMGKAATEALGVSPDAYAFSAGKYAGAVVAAKEKAVQNVASYEGGAPQLEGVPGNLAKALRAGEVGFAAYIPLDAMQSASVRKVFAEAMASTPGMDVPDPALVEAAYDVISPLSSIAYWMTHPAKERVMHLSIDAFADASTDEGKDALEALGKIVAGSDAKTTYAELAKRYPSSSRSLRYKVRADEVEGGVGSAALSASFLLGGAAGIMIPAFTKYIERAKASEAEISAAARELEAARQALEASP